MKKTIGVIVTIACLAAIMLGCEAELEPVETAPESTLPEFTLSGSAEEIGITDANFEAVIRESLNKTDGDLTLADMEKVEEIWGGFREIESIDGIDKCTNLRVANLFGNRINDLSPLAALNFADNASVEINVSMNQITDLSPLRYLGNARLKLSVDDNLITDISVLEGLNLEWLHLRNNEITDISVLSEMGNLTALGLEGNKITDINVLSHLTELEWLNLNNNQISDVSALAGLTKLDCLVLMNNQISNPCPLSNLTQLRLLDLRGNGIENIDCLWALDQDCIMY